jgi:hypothetical protein
MEFDRAESVSRFRAPATLDEDALSVEAVTVTPESIKHGAIGGERRLRNLRWRKAGKFRLATRFRRAAAIPDGRLKAFLARQLTFWPKMTNV